MLTTIREAAARPDTQPDGCLYDPHMARERLIGAQEVRDNFSAVTQKVQEGDEYVLVVRRSKLTVGIVPMWMIDRMRDAGILDEKPPGAASPPGKS